MQLVRDGWHNIIGAWFESIGGTGTIFCRALKLLLSTGQVDIKPKDSKYGQTPLLLVAENGYEAVVKLLLSTGQVDIKSKGWHNGRRSY